MGFSRLGIPCLDQHPKVGPDRSLEAAHKAFPIQQGFEGLPKIGALLGFMGQQRSGHGQDLPGVLDIRVGLACLRMGVLVG